MSIKKFSFYIVIFFILSFIPSNSDGFSFTSSTISHENYEAEISVVTNKSLRSYELKSNAPLRDNFPYNGCIEFSEFDSQPIVRSGSIMFDGLFALANHEAILNSVSEIKDGAYNYGKPIKLKAFQTGELWSYVWTRDLAYSAHLALAQFDPDRTKESLLFKTSVFKKSTGRELESQIIQDTGSGGSYPVSTDRIVWSLGAWEVLKYLNDREQEDFLEEIYPILKSTVEQDRRLIFEKDIPYGLYKGEQSFLDWREQSYPIWTKNQVLPIALSKTLSVNVLQYKMLTITALCADKLGQNQDCKKYTLWANGLKKSINQRLFNNSLGVYYGYLLSNGINDLSADKYDLLGLSLSILLGVADEYQANQILSFYPVGQFGPSVVWPQEKEVPIYHNQGIWPFVTAYWLKAGKETHQYQVVNHGIESLVGLTALNLSNMENYDYVSGHAYFEQGELSGPVVNSRRQLWSVAGYLSMVQDIIFGLETEYNAIRFNPFITAKIRRNIFGDTNTIKMHNFGYKGSKNDIVIHLPEISSDLSGALKIKKIKLNNQIIIKNQFINRNDLNEHNTWEIYLSLPSEKKLNSSINIINTKTDNIYDDKTLHPIPLPFDDSRTLIINARQMNHKGGNLVHQNHFENWGGMEDELSYGPFSVKESGTYAIQTRFSNGNGPINTGITCAIKKLGISSNRKEFDYGYLIMPQSGDWSRWDISSPVLIYLKKDLDYSFRIYEDNTSFNMSYLNKNSLYTSLPGGGDKVCNFVNISDVYINKVEDNKR